jgi:hypothetical protein
MGFMAVVNPLAANDAPYIEKDVSQNSGKLGDYITVTINVYNVPNENGWYVKDDLPCFIGYVGPTYVNDVMTGYDTKIPVKDGDFKIEFEVIIDSASWKTLHGWNTAKLMHCRDVIATDGEYMSAIVYCGFHKYAILRTPTPDGNNVINVGENVVWDFRINLENLAWYEWGTMKDICIVDRFGAELEVDDGPNWTPGKGEAWYTVKKGKSAKITLYWCETKDVDFELTEGEEASLIMVISTGINPSGKQSYTSPCDHEWNSGATLKFKNDEGIQLSANTGSISVKVYPAGYTPPEP